MFISPIAASRPKTVMCAAGRFLRTVLALAVILQLSTTVSFAQAASDILQSLGNGSSGTGSDGLTQQILRSLTQGGSQGGNTQLQPNIQIQNPLLQNGLPATPFSSLQALPNMAGDEGFSPLERLMSLRRAARFWLVLAAFSATMATR